jgi:hypothetical protein
MQAIAQELALNEAFLLAIHKTEFGFGDQMISKEGNIQAALNAVHMLRGQVVMHSRFMFPAYVPSHELSRGPLRRRPSWKGKETNFPSTGTRINCTSRQRKASGHLSHSRESKTFF